MVRLVYRPTALEALDAIHDIIAADDPHAARRFVGEIIRRCEGLIDHPEKGPARPDIRPGLRILPIRRRAVVLYRLEADTVVIVHVGYGGQDYDALLEDDP